MTSSSDPLGHRFADAALLEQALTHRSAGRPNNERLEFLGDALLNLIVAEYIYEHYPKASEGEMTRLRAALVSGAALAELAREEAVGDLIRLGAGELKTGGFRRESILADTLEALVAAIYLDAGWTVCRQLMRELFASRVAEAEGRVAKDPKTRLQELLQAKGFVLPTYELISTSGDDHSKMFEVSCVIEPFGLMARGHGSSRRAAEQSAAEQVFDQAQAAIAARRKAHKA
ncbi:MAG TPA: ribonuclease III [Dokdonella sp.]|nr:ribonuclease III [Dokdonella sp.]